jgi:signal transduction histidine kinase/ActR/RegA family two-component response regulator
MINSSQDHLSLSGIRRRYIAYMLYATVLPLYCLPAFSNLWFGVDINHSILETSTSLIGMFVGVLALVRYYSKREGKILIIGTGLLGAGLLDSVYAISVPFDVVRNAHDATRDPTQWTFEISRLYLSAMFVLSWLNWRLKLSVHGLNKAAEYRIYLTAFGLIIACGLLFWMSPVGEPGNTYSAFAVFQIALPGLMFLTALFGYLFKGHWRNDDLEHWIILFLITNAATQVVFLTASPGTSVHQLQLAHELKILSYLILLAGLLQSVYQTFQDAAQTTLQIAEANVALKLEAEERRRAQAQTEEARGRAEKSDMAKSEFLSSMSHELRTPLNSILGFGQLLETDPDVITDKNKSESVEQIVHAGRHLLELVNEVLDLSRIESGNLDLTPVVVSVEDSVKVCLSLSDPLARQRSIRIETSLNGTEGTYVVADLTRFRQILLNLISNAIKYNRTGGSLRVSSSPSKRDMVRIVVSDSGPGLSEDQIKQIFEPFNRLAAVNSKIEGTGIGLTITKRLVEMMGGLIGVESQPGKGSSFWFELPIANAPAETENTKPVAENNTQEWQSADIRRILYIEDNEANLVLMSNFIARRPDLLLLTATSAESGLELARTEIPDLILMDIHLPGMSGYDAVSSLRQNPGTRSIPVIAVTARATNFDLKLGDEAGFDAYITKPIELDLLYAEIERLLDKQN